MAANLTDRALRALKPKADGSQRELFDGDARGLSARCSTSGGVTWCFSYTSAVTRKRRRLTIGTYPAWTLADARARARDLRRTVEAGGDPIDDAKAKARRMTVAQLVERYLALIEKTQRDHKRVRRSIERDVLPVLGDRPAEDIKRRDIISILDTIVRRGAPRSCEPRAKHAFGDVELGDFGGPCSMSKSIRPRTSNVVSKNSPAPAGWTPTKSKGSHPIWKCCPPPSVTR